jgi:hypothetical protein
MTNTLVDFIKAHALANYENGGWDVVVECYDDAQIAEVLGDASTEAEAIEKFAFMVDIWADRQADAINSAF